jgi:hypothetical protein
MKKLQVFLFGVFFISTFSLALADEQSAETTMLTTDESAQVADASEQSTEDPSANTEEENQLPDCVAPLVELEPLPEPQPIPEIPAQ